MKKLLILILMFMVSVCGADSLNILYGNPPSSQGYDHLDTAVLLDVYSNEVDTIATWHDGDSASGIRVLDTIINVTGTGLHTIYLKGVYDGYPDEWYNIEKWEVYVTVSADITGAGTYNATVYAIDTSGTDDTVSGVRISVKDATGTIKGYAETGSAGYVVFHVDSGQWTFLSPIGGGYVWNDTVCTLAAANTTYDMYGYNIAIGAPTGDSLCRVYGYTYGPDGNAVNGAKVTWSLSGRNIYDVCNSTSIVANSGETYSDSTGLWTLDLLYSQCLERDATASAGDSTLYRIEINYPFGTNVVVRNFDVPSADSVEFTW